MPRYKLTIEYDGTPFSGWQRQADAPSVQEAVERVATVLNKAPAPVFAAGRTDSGVHATGQVAHLDMTEPWTTDKLRDAMNFHLRPLPVSILSAEWVEDEFHARFSATRRHYRYEIINRRAPLTVDANRAWRVSVKLSSADMGTAAQCLIGRHDFTTFRSAACQSASPVKSIDEITVGQTDDRITICINARSFLHNQVRSIVGSLKLVGEGKWQASDLRHALDACDRAACGPVAPACGLYLVQVDY